MSREPRTIFIVYCPGLYEVRNDTGKRFQLEADAVAFVVEKRRRGRMAWLETEHREAQS